MDSYDSIARRDCIETSKRIDDKIGEAESRITKLEQRMAEKDCQFAVINTKLSAILWGLGLVVSGLVAVLIKFVFNF